MSTLRQLRNFWIPWVTTIVLACFSDTVAQVSYTVTDLGSIHNGNLRCAMAVNNQGWTEIMDGAEDPVSNFSGAIPIEAHTILNIDGLMIDVGTLGGPDSWPAWFGGINDRGQAVGISDTLVPDPNGEDICNFGRGLTCRPFLWQNFNISALPTLGGNNGQASAINNGGQITGTAETTVPDSACPVKTSTGGTYPTSLPVLWRKGKVQTLPTVGSDPDGFGEGINDQGHVVGYSG